jgi:hypothetical protein
VKYHDKIPLNNEYTLKNYKTSPVKEWVLVQGG